MMALHLMADKLKNAQVAAEALKITGRVDVLVNNAGATAPHTACLQTCLRSVVKVQLERQRQLQYSMPRTSCFASNT